MEPLVLARCSDSPVRPGSRLRDSAGIAPDFPWMSNTFDSVRDRNFSRAARDVKGPRGFVRKTCAVRRGEVPWVRKRRAHPQEAGLPRLPSPAVPANTRRSTTRRRTEWGKPENAGRHRYPRFARTAMTMTLLLLRWLVSASSWEEVVGRLGPRGTEARGIVVVAASAGSRRGANPCDPWRRGSSCARGS